MDIFILSSYIPLKIFLNSSMIQLIFLFLLRIQWTQFFFMEVYALGPKMESYLL